MHRQNEALAERALEIIRFVGLNGREEDIAGNLSHGHKRLLQVAVGLAPTPRLLLLDEPVAGLLHEDVDRMRDWCSACVTRRGSRSCWWSTTCSR